MSEDRDPRAAAATPPRLPSGTAPPAPPAPLSGPSPHDAASPALQADASSGAPGPFAPPARRPGPRGTVARYALPLLLGIAAVALWQWAVTHYDVPAFVLPSPAAIWPAFAQDFASLMGSLWVTLRITWIAFALAVAGGLAGAVIFSQSRTAEMALYPYAVVLQVTPVLAIAPLILIWTGFEHVERAAVIIALIVAFFPVLSNATLGLRSVDPGLIDMFRLYGATRLQILWRLQLPGALPHILAGMKISGGLALIGAVVAEFVAGSGAATGLAWRITEAGNRLEIPKMFAGLALLAAVGVANFYALALLEWLVLRKWHESARGREG